MVKKVEIIAHRGGGTGVFENKIETIKQTLRKPNIDGIEVDVRLTKDNILVIHHDRGVYVNGKRIWIDKISYSDIQHLGVPTFSEIADLFDGTDKIFNIDVKDERCIKPLTKHFQDKGFPKKLYIDCFDLDVLLRIEEELKKGDYFLSLNPKDSFDFNRRFVIRMLLLLSTIFFSRFIIYLLRKRVADMKVDGISIYHKFATKTFINDLKNFGFKVYVWGTDKEFEIERFIGSGVDGIKTRNTAIFEELS